VILHMISRLFADKKGIVLTMVLFIIIVFVVIGLVLVALMTVSHNSSYQLFYSTQAYYLGESGLEYGLYILGNTLANDVDWTDGTPAANLATAIAFNPPNQSNCTFSVGFAADTYLNSQRNNDVQRGVITSVGTVPATQVFSFNNVPAQRVTTMNVPRIY